jgi:hypothetical protein
MNYLDEKPYKVRKSARKGVDAAVLTSLATGAAYVLEQHRGIPVVVTAPLIGAVLGGVRNLLKKKAPRVFGWL